MIAGAALRSLRRRLARMLAHARLLCGARAAEGRAVPRRGPCVPDGLRRGCRRRGSGVTRKRRRPACHVALQRARDPIVQLSDARADTRACGVRRVPYSPCSPPEPSRAPQPRTRGGGACAGAAVRPDRCGVGGRVGGRVGGGVGGRVGRAELGRGAGALLRGAVEATVRIIRAVVTSRPAHMTSRPARAARCSVLGVGSAALHT